MDYYNKLIALLTTTGLGVLAVLITSGITLGIISLLTVVFGEGITESGLLLTVIQIVFGQVLVFGGLSLIYLYVTDRGIKYVPTRIPSGNEIYVIAFAPFGIVLLTTTISLIGTKSGINPSQSSLLELGGGNPDFYLLMIPIMLLAVGPFEELLYRGIIQTRLTESFRPSIAIIGSSLIFTIAHTPTYALSAETMAGAILSLSSLFAGAVAFGSIYQKTQNIITISLVHGIYNSLLLLTIYQQTV
jgi:membrane protease YdiL (CAAX protease family)